MTDKDNATEDEEEEETISSSKKEPRMTTNKVRTIYYVILRLLIGPSNHSAKQQTFIPPRMSRTRIGKRQRF